MRYWLWITRWLWIPRCLIGALLIPFWIPIHFIYEALSAVIDWAFVE